MDPFFARGGEMGRRISELDWSATDVGPIETWPQSLRAGVRIMLASRYPMFIWWGDKLTNFYNDAYIPILGTRHPDALGQPASTVWREIWDVVGDQARLVVQRGESTWNEQLLLIMERHGYPEETYFTFSYSPTPNDDGSIGGLFCACSEDTLRVLAERRLATLQELATVTSFATTTEEACVLAAEKLRSNDKDIPFALIYLLSEDGRYLKLAAATHLEEGNPARPERICFHSGEKKIWPLGEESHGVSQLIELDSDPVTKALPGGGWPEHPHQAVALRFHETGQDRPLGFLVLGVSPRRAYDESYERFFELVAQSIGTSLSTVRSFEQAAQRAKELAELDRAKSAFFSNVSHELRTPLTLMLGPLESQLRSLPPESEIKRELELVHRNSLRLLRLVNSLLDFSRIEAGRATPNLQPVDLPAATETVASAFQRPIEDAGILFVVSCEPIDEPAAVDPDMWDKIVLNLLSNAYKYTFEGKISLLLRKVGNEAELVVADTGVGVAESELPRLFDRFHRIEGQRSRTYEGTGIGLALVHELIQLHGGTISVESKVDAGTTFTVRIPLHQSASPAEGPTRMSTSLRAHEYADEISRWGSSPDLGGKGTGRSCVLLADDNADMREYVASLLSPYFEVVTASNGREALDRVKQVLPDLVLTDVMMPELDGFALVKALRDDAATVNVPIIMLSARAGEEAKVEGLDGGADDYLIKPFSAQELLARVSTQIRQSRVRSQSESALRESEARLRLALDIAQVGTFDIDLNSGAVVVDERGREIYGWPEEMPLTFEKVQEYFHPADRDWVVAAVQKSLEPSGTGEFEVEQRIIREDGVERWIRVRGRAIRNDAQVPVRIVGTYVDTTDFRKAAEAIRESEERFRIVAQATNDAVWEWNLQTNELHWLAGLTDLFGYENEQIEPTIEWWHRQIHPEDRDRVVRGVEESIHNGIWHWSGDYRFMKGDGTYAVVHDQGYVLSDSEGNAIRMLGGMTDVTLQREAEQTLRALNEELERRVAKRTADLVAKNEELEGFTYSISHDMRAPLRAIVANARIVLEEEGPKISPHGQSNLERLSAAALKMARLTDDLLNYARIGVREVQRQNVDVTRLAEEVAREVRRDHSECQLELSVEPGLRAQCDPSLIGMALHNLLDNACKYRKSGEQARVEFGHDVRDGKSVYFVRDEGIGFDMVYVDKLFLPFERLHREEYVGTGIGLANVRRAIRRHGGDIWAEGTPDGGATFFFTLE